MSIGKRFKELRSYLKLTQEQLADKIGVDKSYIGNVETDKQSPSFNLILGILNEYNISADWLMSGKGKMLPDNISHDEIGKATAISDLFINVANIEDVLLVQKIIKLMLKEYMPIEDKHLKKNYADLIKELENN